MYCDLDAEDFPEKCPIIRKDSFKEKKNKNVCIYCYGYNKFEKCPHLQSGKKPELVICKRCEGLGIFKGEICKFCKQKTLPTKIKSFRFFVINFYIKLHICILKY